MASLAAATCMFVGCVTSSRDSGGGFDLCLSNTGSTSSYCEGDLTWVTITTDPCTKRDSETRTYCTQPGLRCVPSYGCALPCQAAPDCPSGSYCAAPVCVAYLEAGSLCGVDAGPRCPPGEQCEPAPPSSADSGGPEWDAAWSFGVGVCR